MKLYKEIEGKDKIFSEMQHKLQNIQWRMDVIENVIREGALMIFYDFRKREFM